MEVFAYKLAFVSVIIAEFTVENCLIYIFGNQVNLKIYTVVRKIDFCPIVQNLSLNTRM